MKENTLNRPGNWELDEGMAKEEVVSTRETASTNRNGFGFFLVFLILAAFEAFQGYSVLNINEHNSTIFYIGMHFLILSMFAVLWIFHNGSQHQAGNDADDDNWDSRDIVSESISNGDAYGLGIGH